MGNIKFEASNRVRIFTSNDGNFSISDKLYKELWKSDTDIPKNSNRHLCEKGMVKWDVVNKI